VAGARAGTRDRAPARGAWEDRTNAREALGEGHRSSAGEPPAEAAGTAALPGEDRAHGDGEHAGGQGGVEARARRSRRGKLITHRRQGTSGRTRSARKAAPSSMRRVAQEGHAARDLQEKGTRIIAAPITVDAEEATGQVSTVEASSRSARTTCAVRMRAGSSSAASIPRPWPSCSSTRSTRMVDMVYVSRETGR
jgi:hypothetical protein